MTDHQSPLRISFPTTTTVEFAIMRTIKNVGAEDVVYNWNKLLELAQGEFLICMGDDDMLYPNTLEVYDKLISCYPSKDIYHCRTQVIDEQSQPINIQEERPAEESMYSMIWNLLFKNRIQFIGDFLFRVETLRKNGGFYYQLMPWLPIGCQHLLLPSRMV